MNYQLLYEGNSLDQYLYIKQTLQENNIPYKETIKSGNNLLHFLTLFFVAGRGSLGLNRERENVYCIYVENTKYETARALIQNVTSSGPENSL